MRRAPKQQRQTSELKDNIRITLQIHRNEGPLTAKEIAKYLGIDSRLYATAIHTFLKIFVAAGVAKCVNPDQARNQCFIWREAAEGDGADWQSAASPPAPVLPVPPTYSAFKAYMLQVLPALVREVRSGIIEEHVWQAAFLHAVGVDCPAVTVWAGQSWMSGWRLQINVLKKYGVIRDLPSSHQVRLNLRIVLTEMPRDGGHEHFVVYGKHVENTVSATKRMEADLRFQSESEDMEVGLLSFVPRK